MRGSVGEGIEMARRTVPDAPAVAAVGGGTRQPLLDLTIAVVTPLFGGGYETGAADPELPVRAATVRGHLRFWWRACNAHRYASAAALFEDEARLWGQTHREGLVHAPSAIDVEVRILKAGTATPGNYTLGELRWVDDRDPDPRNSYPAYALFPFRGERPQRGKPGKAPSPGLLDVEFSLKLFANADVPSRQHSALQSAAEAAVWGWVALGGIGARTRRGCGALWCNDERFAPIRAMSAAEAVVWLAGQCSRHAGGDVLDDCPPLPLLAGARVALKSGRLNAIAAWREAVNVMKDFRQGDGQQNERSGRFDRFGRTLWPEADSVRAAAGLDMDRRANVHPAQPYYPRAELGLPIVFHFKDTNEPADHTLQVALPRATRMASPVILKPLMVTKSEGYPMALLMSAPFLATMTVDDAPVPISLDPAGPIAMPAAVFDQTKAQTVAPIRNNRPTYLDPRDPIRNARQAFLGFVEHKWATEATDL
jgi:CRISPR-associated protein Cmr1